MKVHHKEQEKYLCKDRSVLSVGQLAQQLAANDTLRSAVE
jgi:hypothetical protein